MTYFPVPALVLALFYSCTPPAIPPNEFNPPNTETEDSGNVSLLPIVPIATIVDPARANTRITNESIRTLWEQRRALQERVAQETTE